MDLAISDGKGGHFRWQKNKSGVNIMRWIPNILSTNLFATGKAGSTFGRDYHILSSAAFFKCITDRKRHASTGN